MIRVGVLGGLVVLMVVLVVREVVMVFVVRVLGTVVVARCLLGSFGCVGSCLVVARCHLG